MLQEPSHSQESGDGRVSGGDERPALDREQHRDSRPSRRRSDLEWQALAAVQKKGSGASGGPRKEGGGSLPHERGSTRRAPVRGYCLSYTAVFENFLPVESVPVVVIVRVFPSAATTMRPVTLTFPPFLTSSVMV